MQRASYHIDVARFFGTRIKKERGCWLWVGAKNQHGVSNARFNGRNRVAHEVAFEMAFGPFDGRVKRTCGRDCVNPRHLQLIEKVVRPVTPVDPLLCAQLARFVSDTHREPKGYFATSERRRLIRETRAMVRWLMSGAENGFLGGCK